MIPERIIFVSRGITVLQITNKYWYTKQHTSLTLYVDIRSGFIEGKLHKNCALLTVTVYFRWKQINCCLPTIQPDNGSTSCSCFLLNKNDGENSQIKSTYIFFIRYLSEELYVWCLTSSTCLLDFIYCDYPSHDPGLAPQLPHRTTSAPAEQQAFKKKMDIRRDTLRKHRSMPPWPPPTETAH